MLVFLATPYSQLCDEQYKVKEEYRVFFEKLTTEIRKMGVKYFLAVERENYGKEYIGYVKKRKKKEKKRFYTIIFNKIVL